MSLIGTHMYEYSYYINRGGSLAKQPNTPVWLQHPLHQLLLGLHRLPYDLHRLLQAASEVDSLKLYQHIWSCQQAQVLDKGKQVCFYILQYFISEGKANCVLLKFHVHILHHPSADACALRSNWTGCFLHNAKLLPQQCLWRKIVTTVILITLNQHFCDSFRSLS